ncbi:exo-alpha-sialidase [Ekhidna sp.]|uniref:exo-alpha-sialidase n=1 Tax=Ekhidna sp. TaxID=2608089 RepID=UPI003BA9AC07
MKVTYAAVIWFSIFAIIISCSQSKEKKLLSELESVESPAGLNASLPYLVLGEDKNLYLSWVEKGDSNLVNFKYAYFVNDEWSKSELIASGNDWFVNWADYPMLAIDKDGNKIAHYLAKSASGTYSYDVNIVLKHKDSSNWSSPIIPHKDGTPTEHGFVTMLPQNDVSFLLSWLDGRNTGGGGHGEHGGGAMTIRSAVIDMNGNLTEEIELDGRVCDCCQTGGAITPKGAIIVYRDRSVDEVRDMAFVTQMDSGWSQPILIAQDNWKIEGCPVNGPRIASYQNTVAAAWFTSALGRPTVKVAFGIGQDFNEPIIIDDTSPAGRVDIVMVNEQEAMVSWMDGGETPAIKYRKVNINGSMSPVGTVAEMSESRSSGFPQMEILGGDIYFAWTQIDGEKSNIRMAKTALE